MSSSQKCQTPKKKNVKLFLFLSSTHWVSTWWDGDKGAKYKSVMMERIKVHYGTMPWNNVPNNISSASDMLYTYMTKENISPLVLFPFTFSFISKLLLFVCLLLGFDSELITSCDAVICSLWCRLRWPNFHLGIFPAVFYWFSASKSLEQVNRRALQLEWNLDLSALLLRNLISI